MNRFIHPVLPALTPIIWVLFLAACTPLQRPAAEKADTSTAAKFDIPGRLERPDGLGTPEEQRYMKDAYLRLTQQIQQAPEHLDAYHKLAQWYMLEARVTGEHGHYFPAALEIINQALARAQSPDDLYQAHFLKASVLLSLHQFDQALKHGREALAHNPHSALVYGVLVDAQVELGNYEQAVAMADKMVSLRPDLRSYARVSYVREIHGDVAGAIEAMKMAVDAGLPGNEDKAWCRLTLGNLYASYGDLPNAELQYALALEERPGYPFAMEGMALLARKKEDPAAAMDWLNQACQLIPEVSFYQEKASLFQELGKTDSSELMIGEVLAMLEDDEAHGHNMGLAFAEVYRDFIQDYPQALVYAKKEWEQRPDNIETNQLMASIYWKLGDVEKANMHIQKARSTGAEDPELLCLAGLIEGAGGNLSQAQALIKRSFSYDPFQDHDFAKEAKQVLNQQAAR